MLLPLHGAAAGNNENPQQRGHGQQRRLSVAHATMKVMKAGALSMVNRNGETSAATYKKLYGHY